ncbi:MAG: hypothetical protein ACTSXP_09540 [Promethearchaeota archaeon]
MIIANSLREYLKSNEIMKINLKCMASIIPTIPILYHNVNKIVE